jgi:hypothetical protein
LNTDASFRFERGVDPELTFYALQRAANLMMEVAGGSIGMTSQDIKAQSFDNKNSLKINLEKVNQLIGYSIPKDQHLSILRDLDFKILSENECDIELEIPAYRIDVTREADVAEEILRIYGFNNIPLPERWHLAVNSKKSIDRDKIQGTISELLVAKGFYEVLNNSLTKTSYAETFEGEILGIKRTSIFQNYEGLKDWVEKPPYFFGSSHSWSINFLKKFPPLNQSLSAEDHLMVFRAIISDGALTISEPLVKHRRGGMTLKKYISLAEKIKKLKVGFPDKHTLLQQLLIDAKDQADLPLLKKYITTEINECELAISLFNTKDISQKIIQCCKFDGISIFFKLRLLTYTAFPSILKPIFFIKK